MATILRGDAAAARDAKVRRMRAEGMTLRAIADHFGCSDANIDRILRCAAPAPAVDKAPEIVDVPTGKLVRELNRRRDAVARGTCDYCGRDLDSEPCCKFRLRHYRIGMQPKAQP